MPHPITRHQCNFCRKHYSTKYDAAKHEGGCLCNPLNRSCFTCNNRTGDYCDKLFRPVFIKGEKIFNCLSWEPQEEYAPDEEYE